MRHLRFKMFISMVLMTLLFLSTFLVIQMYVTRSLSASGQSSSTPFKTADGHVHKASMPVTKTFPITTTATIAGIGDILIHGTVYKDAKTVDGGYDFMPMLEPVTPYLTTADIAIANQETMIGGEALGLSTYPRFNSPFEVGDSLKEIGIDIVSIANNHTLDRGETAIQNAINHWNKLGIEYVGAYVSESDQQTIRIVERNDIKFAFLSYTYGTNGIPIPKGKDYLVNLINPGTIIQEIERAKALTDVIVVSLHFGNEYARMPNQNQKDLAKRLVNAGAHIILGHHPHVLQPPEWITADNGSKSFVIYSLGNFISGQKQLYREIGGIIQVEVEKTRVGSQSTIVIKNPAFLPTYVTKTGYSNFKVIPLKGAQKGPTIYNEITNHMKQWMPDLTILE